MQLVKVPRHEFGYLYSLHFHPDWKSSLKDVNAFVNAFTVEWSRLRREPSELAMRDLKQMPDFWTEFKRSQYSMPNEIDEPFITPKILNGRVDFSFRGSEPQSSHANSPNRDGQSGESHDNELWRTPRVHNQWFKDFWDWAVEQLPNLGGEITESHMIGFLSWLQAIELGRSENLWNSLLGGTTLKRPDQGYHKYPRRTKNQYGPPYIVVRELFKGDHQRPLAQRKSVYTFAGKKVEADLPELNSWRNYVSDSLRELDIVRANENAPGVEAILTEIEAKIVREIDTNLAKTESSSEA